MHPQTNTTAHQGLRAFASKLSHARNVWKRQKFGVFPELWIRFWMRWAGLSRAGRMATRLAAWLAPPHKAAVYLAGFSPRGYVAPSATVHHKELRLGRHVFIGDRVVLYQARGGGRLDIGDHASIFRDCVLETGLGGELIIGPGSAIHPRCQLNAYHSPIQIGSGVMISPNCALYSYNHGVLPGEPISQQPLQSKGPIRIGDGAWLGFGVIVLSGVRIGTGAVIGAGSVVAQDIPDNAIAVGSPARVIKMREDLAAEDEQDRRDMPDRNRKDVLPEKLR